MVARVAKQAVMPGVQHDWRRYLAVLQKVLLSAAVLTGLVMGVMKLNDPNLLPIEKIRAQGTFINLTEAMLLTRAGDIQGGYFNIDVSDVKARIESLPWVDRAYVKRQWPDTLIIMVTEQQALARWGEAGLINLRGQAFYPDKGSIPAGLPQINGPEGFQSQLLEQYQQMNALLAPTGFRIRQLDMDARRSITLQLDEGLNIILGRDAYQSRLERFIRMYEKLLVTEIRYIRQIDMRYTNGFTILRKQ